MDYFTNKTITSSTLSENVVYRINKFGASSLAIGCPVGCHGRTFVIRLLFLSTSVHLVTSAHLESQPTQFRNESFKLEPKSIDNWIKYMGEANAIGVIMAGVCGMGRGLGTCQCLFLSLW